MVVALIHLDTTSRWNWSLYGYDRWTVPNLESLVKRYGGKVYTNFWATSGWTVPSTVSLFTGLHPSEHRVLGKEPDGSDLALPNHFASLASLFKKAGFKTCGICCNYILSPELGYDQGFDYFRNLAAEASDLDLIQAEVNVRPEKARKLAAELNIHHEVFTNYRQGVLAYSWPYGKLAVENARQIVQEVEGDLFLFVNLMECHADYNPLGDTSLGPFHFLDLYRGKYRASELITLYNQCTLVQDALIAPLLEELLRRDAVVLILGDHGEAFDFEGHWEHVIYIGPGVTNVPLVVFWPEVKYPTHQLLAMEDIYWTFAQWLGFPVRSTTLLDTKERCKVIVDGTWHLPHLDRVGPFHRADYEMVVTDQGWRLYERA